MQNCNKYKFNIYSFFLPSLNEYKQLCESFDKTRLVITIFIRTLIYYTIFYYLYSSNYIGYKESVFKMIPFFSFIIILITCMMSLFLSVYMDQKYKKETIQIQVTKKEFIPRSWYNSLLERETNTCPVGYILSR